MTLTYNSSRGFLESTRLQLWWVPNGLTVSRIAITFSILLLFLWAAAASVLGENRPFESYRTFAFYLAVVAVITDLLDGWSARKFGWVTPSGAWLDPLADKVTSITLGLAIPFEYDVGWYLLPYAMVSLSLLWDGWQTSRLRYKGKIGSASMPAKIKTAVLMLSQLLFLVDIAYAEAIEAHRTLLQALALTGLTGAALLSKWSLAIYRSAIR